MKTKSLRECENLEDVCSLERDSLDADDEWSIGYDGHDVSITQQQLGCPVKQSISVPKDMFDKLIEKYNEQQIATPNWREEPVWPLTLKK